MRNAIFFVESSDVIPPCPHCKGSLKYKDSRPRIIRKDGGKRSRLLIRRFRCENCGKIHTELPDCLLPYKHYELSLIAGVIDGSIPVDDPDNESYPCEETMNRWKAWFEANRENVEGYLREAGYQVMDHCEAILLSGMSLLGHLIDNCNVWLEKLIRVIYNSGGFLPAVFDPECFTPTLFCPVTPEIV